VLLRKKRREISVLLRKKRREISVLLRKYRLITQRCTGSNKKKRNNYRMEILLEALPPCSVQTTHTLNKGAPTNAIPLSK
jgi:intein/homing endonuclease